MAVLVSLTTDPFLVSKDSADLGVSKESASEGLYPAFMGSQGLSRTLKLQAKTFDGN